MCCVIRPGCSWPLGMGSGTVLLLEFSRALSYRVVSPFISIPSVYVLFRLVPVAYQLLTLYFCFWLLHAAGFTSSFVCFSTRALSGSYWSHPIFTCIPTPGSDLIFLVPCFTHWLRSALLICTFLCCLICPEARATYWVGLLSLISYMWHVIMLGFHSHFYSIDVYFPLLL